MTAFDLSRLLASFPVLNQGRVLPLRAAGFSGALVFRVQTDHGDYALKIRPESDSAAPLAMVHSLLTRARPARLAVLPQVMAAAIGKTILVTDHGIADVCTWQPGAADFWLSPSPQRLQAACQALAQLHRVWEKMNPTFGPCPGVLRRLRSFQEWSSLLLHGWPRGTSLASSVPGDPVQPWIQPARTLAARWGGPAVAVLRSWVEEKGLLHPCLCDLWHDHVLFQGNAVSGFIDFDSVKWDHPAVDLARLLGSLVGDREDWREQGLTAYHAIRTLSPRERELVKVLDRTGAVAALTHWLRWLGGERAIPDRAAAAQRLSALVDRVGAWTEIYTPRGLD